MSNNFSISVYHDILGGAKIFSFENYLKGIPPQKDYTQKAYDKIKSWLKRDFTNGNDLSKVRLPIKKWLFWLWNNGHIDPPFSNCRPHMRQIGNYIYYHDGTIKNIKTQETTKKFYLNEHGYAVYNGKLVHRLMAEAWLVNPNPKVFTQVNHKNKNRSDNSIENLEWVDPNGNIQHKLGKDYESVPRYYTKGV
jgi:hypothetical protein